nr:retrovirus-related Pol polyprotein LINE-1 [Tanacetum cinerariifolium]
MRSVRPEGVASSFGVFPANKQLLEHRLQRVEYPFLSPRLSVIPPPEQLLANRIEAILCDGHLRSCPSGLGGVGEFRGSRGYGRVAGARRIRVGSWNVVSLTKKLFELYDVLGRHKVDIACFQEERWIMAISIVIDGENVYVISAYTPHVGLSDVVKKSFLDALDKLVRDCPPDQLLIIGGDLNQGAHEGFGYGTRNDAGVHKGFGYGLGRQRILWKNFKRDAVETLRVTISEKLSTFEEDMSARTKQARFRELLLCCEGNQDNKAMARLEGSGEGENFSQPLQFNCYYSRIHQGEVKVALQKMRRNKSLGPDQIPIEAKRYLGDARVKWLSCLLNNIFSSAKMHEEWRLIKVIPISKNKGDAQVCSNYKGIKLLSHTMKLYERVIKRRLRKETRASENQFGFMLGRSITEAIYLLQNLMEKYRERRKDLHMAFSRSVKGIKYCVGFRIEGWFKQKTRELEEGAKRQWLTGVILIFGIGIHRSGRIDDDVTHRIRIHWVRWRAASGVLCDRRLPLKLKGKFYKIAIRSTMLYGSECWPIMKAQENKMEVTELRMLRRTCAPVRRVETLLVDGLRRRGRPKLRWKDRLKQDMKELLWSEDMTLDRST